MTTPQHPCYIQQASDLLETGKCQLPVDWSDLARRVAAHQHYSKALQASYKGNPRLLKLITENAAIALCKDFDREL
jgi:hypothetical protein